VVQLAHHPAQGYLLNMTLQALKEAIAELPAGEKTALASWLNQQEMDDWDRQMQTDFSQGGVGTPLVERVKNDIRAGKFSPADLERP
jgi:hypothetical protein